MEKTRVYVTHLKCYEENAPIWDVFTEEEYLEYLDNVFSTENSQEEDYTIFNSYKDYHESNLYCTTDHDHLKILKLLSYPLPKGRGIVI